MIYFRLPDHPHMVELKLKRIMTIDAGILFRNGHLEIIGFPDPVVASDAHTPVAKIYINVHHRQSAIQNLVEYIIPRLQADVAEHSRSSLFYTIPTTRIPPYYFPRLTPIQEDTTEPYSLIGYRPRCFSYVEKRIPFIIYILPLEAAALTWLENTARNHLRQYNPPPAEFWNVL